MKTLPLARGTRVHATWVDMFNTLHSQTGAVIEYVPKHNLYEVDLDNGNWVLLKREEIVLL